MKPGRNGSRLTNFRVRLGWVGLMKLDSYEATGLKQAHSVSFGLFFRFCRAENFSPKRGHKSCQFLMKFQANLIHNDFVVFNKKSEPNFEVPCFQHF